MILGKEAQLSQNQKNLDDPTNHANAKQLTEITQMISKLEVEISTLYERWAFLEKINKGSS